MDDAVDNLTTNLISEESIKQKLPSIFVDALIVDQKFNIVVVSQNVLQFLEFTADELRGKSINYLAGLEDIAQTISSELRQQQGYFEERKFLLFTKSTAPLRIAISGFYLGLISDINGYIVLKVRNLDEVELINDQLQQKMAELDQFIYRASHDLRGPLATIKGLLNLLKISRNESDLERILPLLDMHANKLDDRLFQLMGLAQAHEVESEPKRVIHFPTLETHLRRVAEQNAFLDFMEVHFAAPRNEMKGVDENLVTSLLTNLFLYLLALPKPSFRNQVFFRMEPESSELKVVIGAIGFELNQALREAIANPESIYSDLMNFPLLINFYAAQKVAWKIKASIKVQIISSSSHRIMISIPIQDAL